jgi:dolichol-phosphate mannosyltransferase
MNVAYPAIPAVDLSAALKGPILVLGGGGFVGANLVHRLLQTRNDVTAVVRRLPAWRLAELDRRHLLEVDLTSTAEMRQMIEAVRPRTIFDCLAYGAYSFETDADLIYRTNFTSLVTLAGLLKQTRWHRTATMPFPRSPPASSLPMPAKP